MVASEKFLYLHCQAIGIHIFDESVFAFVLERKCGSFQERKESNTLVTLYWYMVWTHSCSTPIRVWSIVYLRSGLTTTFVQINELAPHFLFICLRWSLQAQTIVICLIFLN